MRMPIVLASCLAAALLLGDARRSPADDKAQQPLPLKKVVLFNSGVGFFEHDAQVEGNQKIELKFNVDDINDLLKSMVLQDLGGGRISTVNYASKDPITKTLSTFSIDLTNNPSLADLLAQVRGEKIELEAPKKIVGTLVGLERRKEQVGKDEVVEKDYATLLTDDGLRSVSLATVGRIKLLNEQLDSELRQALAVLAMGHDTNKKAVTLNFLGAGKRPVRVGYIQQAPIWKTSYRLVLHDTESPLLQGWAIVENTTEHDWNDVRLTLVSGRPISFVMNLYDPLYINRPVVEPELFASLRPQTYGQDLAEKQKAFARKGTDKDAFARRMAGAAAPATPMSAAAATYGGGKRQDIGIPFTQTSHNALTEYTVDPTRGVQSAAQATDVGELFQYAIDTPVSLPRRQSAMLPIVQEAVTAEKVSIYNYTVQAKHPLNGLRLTNTTGLHLMQGPITVFDGGAYAGDARIEDLSPKSERLISYALDLDTEVSPEFKATPEQLVSVRIAKGTIQTSMKYERSQQYTIKNSGQRAKKVLIEQPYEPAWKLMAPDKPSEKTRNLYRFAVEAQPGKAATLKIAEEQVVQQQLAMTNIPDWQMQVYIRAKVVSDDVKQALTEVVRQKQDLERGTRQKAQMLAEINTISNEQTRIRENMKELDRNSELYNRYVKKFGEQEDQIEKLRDQSQALQQQIDQKQRSLDDYIRGLDIS